MSDTEVSGPLTVPDDLEDSEHTTLKKTKYQYKTGVELTQHPNATEQNNQRTVQNQDCAIWNEEQHQECTTQNKEQIIQHQERTTQNKEQIIQHQDCTIQNKEQIIQHQDCTIQNQEQIIQHQDCTIQNKEQIIQHQDCTILNKEQIIQHQDCTIQNKEQIIQHQDCTILNKEQIIQNQKCTIQKRTIQNPEQIIQNQERFIQNDEHIQVLAKIKFRSQDQLGDFSIQFSSDTGPVTLPPSIVTPCTSTSSYFPSTLTDPNHHVISTSAQPSGLNDLCSIMVVSITDSHISIPPHSALQQQQHQPTPLASQQQNQPPLLHSSPSNFSPMNTTESITAQFNDVRDAGKMAIHLALYHFFGDVVSVSTPGTLDPIKMEEMKNTVIKKFAPKNQGMVWKKCRDAIGHKYNDIRRGNVPRHRRPTRAYGRSVYLV